MKKIYLVRYNESSPGVRVITDAFSHILKNDDYEIIVTKHFPDSLKENEIVITYGPKEAYDAIKLNIPVKLAMLVDNYSLGQLNKARFYFKKGKILFKDFWYSLATGLLYRKRENYIAKNIKHLMFVSQKDIDEFKKRNPDNTYYLVPNGVNIPDISKTLKTKSQNIRLGVLSNWTDVTFHECRWFIEDMLPKLNAEMNARLVVAGKGASEKIVRYFKNNPNIDYLGKVDSLSDFFCNIDIYVATVPRGCGILNKVLDAFAYRTFVIGIPESFSGFSGMQKSYIECSTLEEFTKAIDTLSDTKIVSDYIRNASDYISMNNDWIKNYSAFIQKLKDNKII